MSSWKLVEAEPEEPEQGSQQTDNMNKNRRSQNFRGRGGRNQRGGRGRGRNNRYHLSKADRNYLAYMAVQQIELIFSLDNLCMDTFIRSYMDEEGYIPVALVCSYQNVACFCAPYQDIIARIQTVCEENGNLEFNAENETIRLKEGWDMWLMPNMYGGKGQPKYLKQPMQNTENSNSEILPVYGNNAALPYEYYGNNVLDPFNPYSNGQNIEQQVMIEGLNEPTGNDQKPVVSNEMDDLNPGKIQVGDVLVQSMGEMELRAN